MKSYCCLRLDVFLVFFNIYLIDQTTTICVCVRACVRACVCVSVHACVRSVVHEQESMLADARFRHAPYWHVCISVNLL